MMKTLLKALLAATALMPVAATAQDERPDRGDRGGFRAPRGGAERPQRQERAPQQQAPEQAAPQPQAAQAPARQFDRREGRPDGQAGQRQQFRQDRTDGRQAFRAERRDDRQALQDGQVTRPEFRADRQADRQGFRAGNRDDRQDFRDRREADRGQADRFRADRFRADKFDRRPDYRQDRRNDAGAVTRARLRRQYGRNDAWRDQNRSNDRGAWNRGWRNDNRYDYNHYRSFNRNAFHLPRYYAPYGWNSGYRRFSIGFSLNSVLFGENYWIDDPWYYRLPPADGPYRWVRYYNDALLVDLETGEVVDTVYGIFW